MARSGTAPAGAERSSAVVSSLRGLLVLGSLWYTGLYLFIAVRRIGHPYGLEWMEGGSLEHVARVLEGKALYVEPTLEFTPFLYTPLYYWVCAPVARLLGTGLPALRVVSFVASLGVLLLLHQIVYARTANRFAALCAVGLFTACFEITGAWLDLARVDSLFLLLSTAAIAVLVRSRRHDGWAGLLLALAFLTKQTTLVIAVPLIAARFTTQSGLRRVELAAVFCTVAAASTLLLDRGSGGWFRYYAFELPDAHPWTDAMRTGHFRSDLFPHLPFAISAALYALLVAGELRGRMLLCGAGLGMLASGWMSRLHAGGFVNVLLPSVLFVAWASAEALHACTARGGTRATAQFALLLGCAQLAALAYSPVKHLPTARDEAAGDALVAHLRGVSGPVLAPFDPLLPRLAGKTGSAHEQAIVDVILGERTRPGIRHALEADIRRALAEKRYAAIVLDRDWWAPELNHTYRRVFTLPLPREDAAFTRSGFRTRPEQLWVAR